MLIKILFTMAVIIVVIVFFRRKRGDAPISGVPAAGDDGAEDRSISPRALAYSLLGALAGISLLIFELNRRAQNRIVTIRVISDGATTRYQAQRKSIKGRRFVTLDGAQVILGESDRMELLDP